MPAITVKNIPDSLYGKLKHSAKHHRRSINSELIACLEQVLTPQKISADEHILAARNIRQRLNGFTVSEEDLQQAKTAGRP